MPLQDHCSSARLLLKRPDHDHRLPARLIHEIGREIVNYSGQPTEVQGPRLIEKPAPRQKGWLCLESKSMEN